MVRNNTDFLTEIINRFHDERTGLSLYSDLGQYRLTVSHKDDHEPELYVYYDTDHRKLDDIVSPLETTGKCDMSPYDDHIASKKNQILQLWVNCSQKYRTYIVSDGGGIEVSLSTGEYDPKRATPAAGGDEVKLVSAAKRKWHVVDLAQVRDRL
jgi:hypothetical protein